MSISACLFLSGYLSPQKKFAAAKPQQHLKPIAGTFFLTLFIVGVPFTANALEKGWVSADFRKPLKYIAFAIYLFPFYAPLLLSFRKDQGGQARKTHEQEAALQWEAGEALELNE